jgi:hypothetical protein
MSVPKHRRGISNMEFHYMVCKLRKEITAKPISDFGLRHKFRQIHIYGGKIIRDEIASANSEETEETDIVSLLRYGILFYKKFKRNVYWLSHYHHYP